MSRKRIEHGPDDRGDPHGFGNQRRRRTHPWSAGAQLGQQGVNVMSVSLPVLDARSSSRSEFAFQAKLAAYGMELRAAEVHTLQVNVDKLCNQACKHCHVDAGPSRTEIMTRETAEQVIAAVRNFGISTFDITGGAPE